MFKDLLNPGDVIAGRLAYALHRARPWLSTLEISVRLAGDYGVHDRRRRPIRCKRLRRLIASYEACIHAGVEPLPETIFGD